MVSIKADVLGIFFTLTADPVADARELMRKLFTPYELATCNVRGVKKAPLDPIRVRVLKHTIMNACQVPTAMQPTMWNLCIKAMDSANRNIRRSSRKLSM